MRVPALTIRPSRPADFDALVELDLASAAHHAEIDPEVYRVPDRAAAAAFLRRRLEDPDRRVVVAEVDDAVVGMVDVTIAEEPDPGSVVRPVRSADVGISVLDGWRGRGIGAALMAAAEESARARGARQVILDMASANDDALRFYERLGYREYGRLLRRPLDEDEDEEER